MGETTAIEWAESTINFFMGCTKVSEGCKNCYMYRDMVRYGKNPFKINRMNFDNIEKKLKSWSPRRIFVNSMSDTFHEGISLELTNMMFDLMQKYPKHTYLILTKRPLKMHEYFYGVTVPSCFWLGVSCENQNYVHRIDRLKQIDCEIRFVSFEPLLSGIDHNLTGISWAIVGGESDYQDPRPLNPHWVDSIKYLCERDKVKFFFKQWGGKSKCSCHGSFGCRLYQGRTWDEMPLVENKGLIF
ncbi:MAG: DUF5131 family protein [Patescibacteria group bacterium]|nr:DUF5131 family protein [Patescibacteria group bacterium]